MEIDAQQRRATLSVGEFSTFRPYAQAGYGGSSAIWRAQVGTEWHQRIQAASAQAGEGMANEVGIEGSLEWRGWTLQLRGRIDQLKETGQQTRLREIKTVAEPLPIDAQALKERYASYPIQLLAYRELLIRQSRTPNPPSFCLELLFVEISSGLTQSVHLSPEHDHLFARHLDTVVDFLESQRERLDRLRALKVRPAYSRPRPGQESIQADLRKAFASGGRVILEAPTGYGKTGVSWEFALKRLANGQEDRIVYLTSKSTGQIEAAHRLRSLLGEGSEATFWHIRNKQEHCIHHEFRCSSRTCPYLTELEAKWQRSGLQRLYLLSRDEVPLESIKQEGQQSGICPYEIMRAGLGFRDVWIGDYNYLFSPQSARLLDEQNDFAPHRTFLILDEAHNLPSRVASAFSFDLSLRQCYAAIDDLRSQRAARAVQGLLKGIADILQHLPTPEKGAARPSDSPSTELLQQDFFLHLRRTTEALSSEALPYDDLAPETLDLLFLLSSAHASHQSQSLRHALWSPEPGQARLECIDASRLIQERLSPYRSVLFLSATLTPIESFLEQIGDRSAGQENGLPLPGPSVQVLRPPAPWRDDAYSVAIDLRINTRYATREKHLSTTARTIARACELAAPAVVFFPSYAYAQRALDELSFHHPMLRAIIQPRRQGSLQERQDFLDEAIAFHDAVFLILGSSYAEGVDSLGGKAGSAIVVSPALPELNHIQETKRRIRDAERRDGFERIYLQPGIQKVNQALGRLVRAPEHRVKALLHCERFAEPKTRELLDPLYRSQRYIQNEEDLDLWLSS